MISIKLNLFSNVLSMNNDVRILMPDRIQEDELLKVLWLCHGGSGDENEWLYYSTAAKLADEKRIAIVMVNANDSCFTDMVYGLSYMTYIGKELPEILYTMFPHFSSRREDNWISGLSNGGYGCLLIGLSFPDRYGAIGAFSAGDKADSRYQPASEKEITPRIRMFGKENIRDDSRFSIRALARKVSESQAVRPRIYHACGSRDPWLDLNLLVRKTFEEINDPEYDYVYDEIEGVGHEWPFWDEELRRFLAYAVQKTGSFMTSA